MRTPEQLRTRCQQMLHTRGLHWARFVFCRSSIMTALQTNHLVLHGAPEDRICSLSAPPTYEYVSAKSGDMRSAAFCDSNLGKERPKIPPSHQKLPASRLCCTLLSTVSGVLQHRSHASEPLSGRTPEMLPGFSQPPSAACRTQDSLRACALYTVFSASSMLQNALQRGL